MKNVSDVTTHGGVKMFMFCCLLPIWILQGLGADVVEYTHHSEEIVQLDKWNEVQTRYWLSIDANQGC